MTYKDRNIKKWLLLSLVIVVACFMVCIEKAYTYTLVLPQDVKIYCQNTGSWCGAASVQMIINSYPVSGECVFRNQQEIMDKICQYEGGIEPCKDPNAVRDTIMTLDSPTSSAHWSVFSDTDKSEVMYDIMYWMVKREYPTATIARRFHWVVITGFTASADPLENNEIELETVTIHDSFPFCNSGGNLDEELTGIVASPHVHMLSADTWYENAQYWENPATLSGWNGKYVAIIEPPKIRGRATAPKEYIGIKKEIIPPEQASEHAAKWVEKLKLTEREHFRFFEKLVPQSAVLVHWPEWQKYYYLVPFGWEKDRPARGWFVINAYNGNFQEVGGYRTKFLCLFKEEAIKIALNALRETGVEKYEIIKAELIFKYSEQAYGRQFPLWQVTIDRLLPLYVGQDGKVYWELTPPPC